MEWLDGVVVGADGGDESGAVAVPPPGGFTEAPQVSVYAAGREAATTGLVITSTASPVPDAAGGAMTSGRTAWVPARWNVTVVTAESRPLDSAQ